MESWWSRSWSFLTYFFSHVFIDYTLLNCASCSVKKQNGFILIHFVYGSNQRLMLSWVVLGAKRMLLHQDSSFMEGKIVPDTMRKGYCSHDLVFWFKRKDYSHMYSLVYLKIFNMSFLVDLGWVWSNMYISVHYFIFRVLWVSFSFACLDPWSFLGETSF